MKNSLTDDTDDGLSLGGVGNSDKGDEDDEVEDDPDANSGVEYLPAPTGATAMGPYKKKKKLVGKNYLGILMLLRICWLLYFFNCNNILSKF